MARSVRFPGIKPAITEFSVDSGIKGDRLTNDPTVTLNGTADPSVIVRIYADGLLVGTTRSDETGGWSFTTPDLVDDTYGFTAETGKGRDRQISYSFVASIDSFIATPEIASATPDETGLLLTGTAEAGASVDIYRNFTLLGTVAAAASGLWEFLDASYAGESVSYSASATDAAGNTAGTTADLIYPPPLNAAPVLTSPVSVSVIENQIAVLDPRANDDADADGAGLSYAITSGPDSALFSIDDASGALAFVSPPDFENPGDVDRDSIHHVQVTVTDSGSQTDSRNISVTVTDAEEDAPQEMEQARLATGTDETATFSAMAGESIATESSATPTIFEARVAASIDDVEENAKGTVTLNSSDLELAVDGTKIQTVGIRFTGIDIPPGAIITGAYIQFTTDQVSTGAVSLSIRGEDADDATAFTTAKFSVSSRLTTDAAVSWSPGDWTVRGEAGFEQRTPDLSAIVQEIVDRFGWATLNGMVFLITGSGTRNARAYDSRPESAPLLHIEFYVPSTGDPVVFNSPADSDPTANQIAELAAAGAPIGITASASDPDAGDIVRYSVDDPRFAIDPNGVVTRSGFGMLDFETETSITLTVTATSSDRSTATRTYTVNVLDSPEPVAFNTPPDADLESNRLVDNAAVGTRVGITASARDPDAGSIVTYSVNDNRFAIDANGVITRSSIGTLNAQSQPSINLVVTATSSDGSTATESFSVSVVSNVTSTILERRVMTSADDVEEGPTGSMSIASSDLELAVDGSSNQTVGIRFTGLDIPKGAIITKAYIQFTVDTVTTGTVSLMIRGEDADDAAAFTTAKFNASSRLMTDAAVAWQPPDWTTRGEAGLAQRTPDLAAVVQEIVDRFGWAALNDMVFLITGTGTRNARAYDSRPEAAPLLHLEYYVPPASDPVAFNDPDDIDATANQIAELATEGMKVGITASASDPDAGDTVTYSVNDSRFAINSSGEITRSAIGSLDFETEALITLTVTATSSDRSTATRTFTLNLLDSPEPVAFNTPADSDATANRILQSASAGTRVGITASAKDPDAGATVTYSISDSRFVIDAQTGVITRSGTGTLNAQLEPSIALAVTATSSDGSSATQAYTVDVVSQLGPQTLYRFAIFGDYGDTDLSGEKAVAALVKSWNVNFILTVGDNVYAPQTLDNAVGQQFHEFISNYRGAFGSGSAFNRFFPTLGNHEYNDGNVAAYLDYFTLPDNERYYDFQIGPVHFFALNSDSDEPDGRSSTSTQGQWMKSILDSSNASLNVAFFHHTPYNPSGSTSTMRWPFEPWGVNAVFAGHQHNYYRENRDDNGDGVQLPYTTTGLGGAGRDVPDVGASLVTVTDAGMLIEFYRVSNFNGTTATSVLTDSYFVPTPAGRVPTIVDGGYVLNGTSGADYLWGLGGNATLIGGRGSDTLVGGNNQNLFAFHTGDGQDTILNFRPGAASGDVLDLRAYGIQNASAFRQIATDQGSNVLANLATGDQLLLLGVHLSQFHDDNFLRNDLLLS
ncbi:MAG: metallophosphoesterase [Ensifer alkalisoli]|nr:metallophosphoesterase [Sinorhizobium alkalisoli]